ncbi:4'-phosphopantetheinyl transferase family protein [Heyndrickxia sporothermodurans]|uniref:4'-phosphopantetheinyl transferase family protein n=1 Tax=Heyndrickxia sporothermodurans TaxID=46224 RepID=UPI002E1A38B0|nr:4'-phosphopantetheinyl transferase superfamily protein [Heyndrickxia sporothermodurans]MED3650400.1 4'-phosphopantetheinyl transferase superfamily protein [Heyndrickxia sporothermodurans]MED3698598.1 4'-phosphopantetheinyl transferase superfamily protein [Heyndrickxia sporothermodurans]MED3780678.1 4'-phosphopantetheinyl transferase superfamily protein [Heyndrickxia sporothermodurans]
MLSQDNIIRICQISASFNPRVYDQLFRFINTGEKDYLLKYKKFADRYNSLLALSLVKRLTNKKLNVQLSLLHTELGQPYLTGHQEHISISHCENTIVVAMSTNKVGIDVEKNLSTLGYEFELFLADEEYELLNNSKNKVDFITTLWTLKEAYLKLIGRGFFIDPTNISFNKIKERWFLKDDFCSFFSRDLPNGMKLSIASEVEKEINFEKVTESELIEWLNNSI